MKYKLTISIVTYNNKKTIAKVLDSIHKSAPNTDDYRVFVVDNGSSDGTVELIGEQYPWVSLIKSGNVGFGAGHNKALKEVLSAPGFLSQYHLIMNPDVYFEPGVPDTLMAFMDDRPAVGLVMPKILYPDGSTQHLCKLLPTPLDSIGRRFIPGFLRNMLFGRRFRRYEMLHRDYDKTMEVPHLSGCFMMVRTKVFQDIGLFDERFFMYMEDVDLSRRILEKYKNLYYPEVAIYHHYHKGSYKGGKLLKHHIRSALKYFNKWGWFFDKERKNINMQIGGNHPL